MRHPFVMNRATAFSSCSGAFQPSTSGTGAGRYGQSTSGTGAGRYGQSTSGEAAGRYARSPWVAFVAVAIACVWSLPFASADDRLDAAYRIVRDEESRRIAVVEKAAASTVCIFADKRLGGGGSGVVITPDGYGLTNFHVVAELLETRKGFGGLSDGNLYPLAVLGIDPGGDVAMFKLSGKEGFDFSPLGDSDSLKVGDWTIAAGNPFLVAEDFTPTISFGVVGGVHRYQAGVGNNLEYADCIQVSTSINPGNSGGPLFDMNGRIVGINGRGSFEERGRVNVGLGYAIGINQIKRFIPALRAGRLCEHGTLGATTRLVGRDLVFDAVQDASPASRAGAGVGDRLLALAGHTVKTPNDVLNVIGTLPAGWPTPVTFARGGREMTGTVRLERLPPKLDKRFDVDVKLNLAEVRRMFERYERTDRGLPGARFSSTTWSGMWFESSAGGGAPVEIEVQHSAAAIRVQAKGWPAPLAIDLSSPRGAGSGGAASAPVAPASVPASDNASAPPAGAAADAALWREWCEISEPLWWRPKISLGWEMLGGDDLNGRFVDVVERRYGSGRRARWKFDHESGVLLAVAVGDEREPESAIWLTDDRATFAGASLPVVWRRYVGGKQVLSIALNSVRLELAATAPASAPASEESP